MQQAHIFITGKVQGVGFRQFILQQARKRGLTGWVQNLPGGRVEAVVQGERRLIEEMLIHVKRGPFLSQVHTIETKWEDSMAFVPTFTIKHAQQ